MKIFTCIVCFLFPNRFSFWILNLLGHEVSSEAVIGFSIIWISGKLSLKKGARIGHLNLIRVNSLSIKEAGYFGRFNKLVGPFEIDLDEKAAIGNNNKCYRAPDGISYGKAFLKIGLLSKITSGHRVDCTRSVTIGDYSIIAGHDSQLWTHAYYHDRTGPGRFRVDGEITIGNNVYIGSRVTINNGVSISNGVVVGSNVCVSKSLQDAGTYVSQPLRFIAIDENADQRSRFRKVEGYKICEEVYEKPV